MKNLKQIWKVLKLLSSLSQRLIPITVLHSLLKSGLPFIPILASSMILNKLAEKAPMQELFLIATVAVLLSVGMILLSGFFKKQEEIEQYHAEQQLSVRMAKKILEMDYQNLENPDVHLLKESIDMDEMTMGGIWNIFWQIGVITKNIFSIIISAFVLSGLFQTTPLETTPYTWIQSPFLLVALLLLTAVIVIYESSYGVRQMKAEFTELNKLVKGNRMFMFFTDTIHNYKTGKDVRIYQAKSLLSTGLYAVNKSGDDVFKKICQIEGMSSGVEGALSAIVGGLVYIFVGLKAWLGVFGIGSVIRYAGAIHECIGGLSFLVKTLVNMSSMCDRLQNIFSFLEYEDSLYKGSLPIEKRADNEYEIEFHNVSFQYPGTTAYALKNLNLKFNIGQRLAVVGMNGSGKTTMIKLLGRLYDPTQGEITLNGVDIRKYRYEEYMNVFSVVFQDFKLFSFHLGQNVAASVNVDRKKAEDSLKKAGFGERLSGLAKGLDTPLYQDFEEDGVEISGGEAQKIALARAIYKDAPFLILDEPTAALDPIAEYEIYSKFDELVGSKTAIYISHRLSSCRFCDDIAVFDEGRLIQRGNHQTLLADEAGKYYALWNAQAQYYQTSK